MSQVKRRTKKSLNSSISEISNSEKLRNSSIFKNDVLSEIKNIHVGDVIRTCRKENLNNSSKKNRTVSKPVAEVKDTIESK